MVLSKIPGAPPISRISSVSPECWAKWVGTKCPKLRGANSVMSSHERKVSITSSIRLTNGTFQSTTPVSYHERKVSGQDFSPAASRLR